MQPFLRTDVRVFFQRLKTEREALGLSQQALAERLGVALRSQQNYESGTRVPDVTYLGLLGAIGADVLYLVTGNRTPKCPPLDPAEQILVDSFRRCTSEGRINLIQTAAVLSAGLEMPNSAKRAKEGSVRTGDINQQSTQTGSVQVGYAGGSVRVKKTRSN
ncbi:helix-turn-helix domain-containing protein [Delftia deserti]|uniref:Helix-turn-helix domain-containing protein n=1 Tax=Delftia deserti TaxID=1651218 RepID=A0ABW5EJA1_9BURK